MNNARMVPKTSRGSPGTPWAPPSATSKLLSSRLLSHRATGRPAGIRPGTRRTLAAIAAEEDPGGPENRPWPGHDRGGRRAGRAAAVVAVPAEPDRPARSGADRGRALPSRAGRRSPGHRGLRPAQAAEMDDPGGGA